MNPDAPVTRHEYGQLPSSGKRKPVDDDKISKTSAGKNWLKQRWATHSKVSRRWLRIIIIIRWTLPLRDSVLRFIYRLVVSSPRSNLLVRHTGRLQLFSGASQLFGCLAWRIMSYQGTCNYSIRSGSRQYGQYYGYLKPPNFYNGKRREN